MRAVAPKGGRATAVIVTPPNFTLWTTRNELGLNKTVELQANALGALGCQTVVVSEAVPAGASGLLSPAPWLSASSGRSETHRARVATLREHLGRLAAGREIVIMHDVLFCGPNIALTEASLDVARSLPQTAFLFWSHEIERPGGRVCGYDFAWGDEITPPFDCIEHLPPNCRVVFISTSRQLDILTQSRIALPSAQMSVVLNGLDVARTAGASAQLATLLEEVNALEAFPLLLLPARMLHDIDPDCVEGVLDELAARKFLPLLISTLHSPHEEDRGYQVIGRWARRLDVLLIGERMQTRFGISTLTDDDVAALYRISDCLLFPSRREGFGMPLIEAALARLPVLCTSLPVFEELLGERAFFLDRPKIAGGVDRLMSYLGSNVVASAHRLARTHFDGKARLHAFFGELLSARRSG